MSGRYGKATVAADANAYHVATINAFSNKFDTYTGAVRNEETRQVERQRFNSLDEARNWVKQRAWDIFGPVNYAPVSRKNEYYANVWKIK